MKPEIRSKIEDEFKMLNEFKSIGFTHNKCDDTTWNTMRGFLHALYTFEIITIEEYDQASDDLREWWINETRC